MIYTLDEEGTQGSKNDDMRKLNVKFSGKSHPEARYTCRGLSTHALLMDLRIKTSDYDMPREVADYLDEKIDSIQKLLGGDADTARCEVELGRAVGRPQQGDIWRAEIIVHHEGERHVARATGESVNAAIDIAKDEILQQLRKSKGRTSSLARRMGARIKRLTRFGQE